METQRVERSVLSILLLVGLLTFFFPLVTFQIPLLGNQSMSGYDMFSKARDLSEQLSTKHSEESGTDLWQSASEPSKSPDAAQSASQPFRTAGGEQPLPISVQFAALIPLEATLGFGCVVIAIPGCFLKFKPGYVKVVSIVGSLASVIAILHLTVINSDLHMWFQKSMKPPVWDSHDNPFSGFAQQVGNLLANSFQVKPGAGLYVLAAALVLVAFLSHSRLLGGTQAAEPVAEGILNDSDEQVVEPHNAKRTSLVLIVAMMVCILGVIIVFANRSWRWFQSPATSPVIFGPVMDARLPAVSLLNPPVIQPVAVASWDSQNIRGVVLFEARGNDTILRYPNGSQFVLSSKLYSPNGKPFIAEDAKTGTLTVSSGFPMNQENWKPWSIQLPTDKMRDINGDGWPEVVLADYSGGAHCCTRVTVLSVRPTGPVCIFSEELGSASVRFSDLNNDSRMEIVTTRLAEYALGSFASGTYGIPVIYAANSKGVYQIDTRAFADVLKGDLDAELTEISTRGVGIEAEEFDSQRVDLFFLKYLNNQRSEAYVVLNELIPTEELSVPAILGKVKQTLKAFAPEVLTEPKWVDLSNQRSNEPNVADQVPEARTTPAAVDGGGSSPARPVIPAANDTSGSSRQTKTAVLTGVYSGRVHNTTAQLWATFGATILEREGNSLAGCMFVHRPLYGSGKLHGNSNPSQVTFDVPSAVGVIRFTGTREGDAITGTYVVQHSGGMEYGEFELHRQGELPTDFDTRNCPDDSIVR
jgi:hypothetical protein